MSRTKSKTPIARAIGVISAVLIVVSGVTFAALQSQDAKLSGSRISSATASLLIGDNQNNFTDIRNGFDFTDVIPGGPAAPAEGKPFNLLNQGSADLKLRAKLNPNVFSQQQSTELNKVYIVIKDSMTNQSSEVSVGQLLNSYYDASPYDLGLTIPGGTDRGYSMQVRIDGDAVGNGRQQIVMQGLDLIFSGITTDAA